MKIKTSTTRKRLPVVVSLIAGAIILVGGGITVYSLLQPADDRNSDDSMAINYDPPTQQEIDSSQDSKKNGYSENKEDANNTDGDKKSVNVGISFADIYNDNLEIRAFTNGVIEGDGTCTATITRGSTVITKSSEAFIDTSSSQCRPIYVPKTELNSGTWQIIVKFSSLIAEGASESVEVTI